MSRLTEEIRRLSGKLDNLEQRLEKVEESLIPKFTAPEAPQEPKFKVGDRFIPHKPKDENEYPTWWRLMDRYDGEILTVAEITRTGNLGVGIDIDGNDWCFNPSWCTKVEEPKFKKGDRIIYHHQEGAGLEWGKCNCISIMAYVEKRDGKEFIVDEITPDGHPMCCGGLFVFHSDLCTKVEEPKPRFKKGDWVRSLITGTVGKVEAFYEEGNHSRYLLSTIDGNHFTSRENVIEPYFPKEGEYIYVYFKKSEQRYIVIFSHTNTTYLYDKCLIYLNTDKLEISKIPFCYADLIYELRPASAEEKKLFDSKLAEKGLRFDGKEIVKDNTPKVGDFCIFWNSEKPYAHCAILGDINTKRGRPYTDKCGDDYRNCIPFESVEQYKNFIKE